MQAGPINVNYFNDGTQYIVQSLAVDLSGKMKIEILTLIKVERLNDYFITEFLQGTISMHIYQDTYTYLIRGCFCY